jgi:hypothetical protein
LRLARNDLFRGQGARAPRSYQHGLDVHSNAAPKSWSVQMNERKPYLVYAPGKRQVQLLHGPLSSSRKEARYAPNKITNHHFTVGGCFEGTADSYLCAPEFVWPGPRSPRAGTCPPAPATTQRPAP